MKISKEFKQSLAVVFDAAYKNQAAGGMQVRDSINTIESELTELYKKLQALEEKLEDKNKAKKK